MPARELNTARRSVRTHSKRPAEETTRAKILRVSRQLIRKYGHLEFSLRRAAEAAGLSAPSVYSHFRSREDLLRAISDDTRLQLREAVAHAAQTKNEIAEQLVEMGMAYVRFALENREDFLLCFVASKERMQSLEDGLPEHTILILAVNVINEGLECGELEDRGSLGAVGIAYSLWAAVHGMAMLRLTYLSAFRVDFEEINRSALNSMISAWRREPRP